MPKNKHNKTVGSKVERSDDRIKETGEVFTPMELCYQMVDDIDPKMMQSPESTFLDNSAGSGNFLAALLDRLVNKFKHDKQYVLDNMLYCIEFMDDNHTEICERLGVPKDHPHYVCGDGLDQGIYTRWEREQPEPTEFKEGGGTLF
jgi:hypothetical protein